MILTRLLKIAIHWLLPRLRWADEGWPKRANQRERGNAGTGERGTSRGHPQGPDAIPRCRDPAFPSLRFDQASSHRVGGGLDAATHAQLPVHALEVVADGVWTQHELPADRGDIGTAHDELQNLQFAAG